MSFPGFSYEPWGVIPVRFYNYVNFDVGEKLEVVKMRILVLDTFFDMLLPALLELAMYCWQRYLYPSFTSHFCV